MTDTELKISNYELGRLCSMLSEAAKLPPGRERTCLLIGSHVVLVWILRSASVELKPLLRDRDPEKQFQMVLAVIHEYLIDLDSDIEGCTGDDLADIESQMEAARQIRSRLVAHVCEGRDARGEVPFEGPSDLPECSRCRVKAVEVNKDGLCLVCMGKCSRCGGATLPGKLCGPCRREAGVASNSILGEDPKREQVMFAIWAEGDDNDT